MQTTTMIPEPSSKHATCAWCSAHFDTIIELIDHVDDRHLARKTDIEALAPWSPTSEEVAAALDAMRPVIDRLAARDQRQLDEWAAAA